MDLHDRLRLATRLHFALRQHHGLEIAVDRLLDGSRESCEALWVCEASDSAELRQLAAEMRRLERIATSRARPPKPMPVVARPAPSAVPAEAAAQPPAAPAPQEAAWARNTSGFGLSTLSSIFEGDADGGAERGRSWLRPSRWLKRGSAA